MYRLINYLLSRNNFLWKITDLSLQARSYYIYSYQLFNPKGVLYTTHSIKFSWSVSRLQDFETCYAIEYKIRHFQHLWCKHNNISTPWLSESFAVPQHIYGQI